MWYTPPGHPLHTYGIVDSAEISLLHFLPLLQGSFIQLDILWCEGSGPSIAYPSYLQLSSLWLKGKLESSVENGKSIFALSQLIMLLPYIPPVQPHVVNGIPFKGTLTFSNMQLEKSEENIRVLELRKTYLVLLLLELLCCILSREGKNQENGFILHFLSFPSQVPYGNENGYFHLHFPQFTICSSLFWGQYVNIYIMSSTLYYPIFIQ